MNLLALDTVTDIGGVALLAGERLEARDLGERGRHAEALVGGAEALLSGSGLSWTDLDLVVVNVGPGSFTGIRVGLATALGWGEARGLRVGGVRCLDIQAWACYHATLPPVGAYMISAADVRRGEVVCGGYRIGPSGPVPEGPERLAAVADPGIRPEPGWIVTGNGASLLWPERSDLVRWAPKGTERAEAAARFGKVLCAEDRLEPAEPRYARPADAKPRRRE